MSNTCSKSCYTSHHDACLCPSRLAGAGAPPGAPRWEDTAIGWLFDQCPADYRVYAGLRRHPVVLARFAALHTEASIQAAQRGISEARTSLREVLPTESVEGAISMWEREAARLLSVRRGVGLIEDAFRGRQFRARL
ncbi:MAG: hypothetical protein WKF73_22735 [Nocardioidaceae bacterium]